MRDADRLVAILDLVDEDAEAVDVGKLLERNLVALHLAPDRIGLLLAPAHVAFDAAAGELVLQFVGDAGDDRAVLDLQLLQPRHDERMRLRHQVAEGEILQFAAQALHAHAAGERRVNLHRVLGDARALGGGHEIERAHVVQTVGELDQQHARVVGDGEQQLAEIFRLDGVLGGEIELVELGQAVDEAADLDAEDAVDLIAGDGRVLDRVVQHRGGYGCVVELELGQDGGDFERVREIRVAARPLLRAMRLHGEHVGAVEEILVRVRIVTPDPFDQFVLPHHVGCSRLAAFLQGRIDSIGTGFGARKGCVRSLAPSARILRCVGPNSGRALTLCAANRRWAPAQSACGLSKKRSRSRRNPVQAGYVK